jgi:RNA polymerase sigma-70 factor (ECF subfamily)
LSEVETRLRALMTAGLDGDQGAYRQALRLCAGFLRGYFGRRLGPAAADVEDLVQETLLAIHLKRDTYGRGQPFTPWVHAIARYKLIDHFRRVSARPSMPIEDAAELWAQENPEEGAVRHDVKRLLDRLPARQRALMEDVKLAGLSMEEAAQRSGMSVSAVKVSVHRGMKRLSEEVSDENG